MVLQQILSPVGGELVHYWCPLREDGINPIKQLDLMKQVIKSKREFLLITEEWPFYCWEQAREDKYFLWASGEHKSTFLESIDIILWEED